MLILSSCIINKRTFYNQYGELHEPGGLHQSESNVITSNVAVPKSKAYHN